MEDEKRTYEICRWIDFGFISCSGFEKADILKQLTLMHTWGCKVCVATMGEFGSIAITENEACSFQPEVVDALDTLGAGDSFAAGFLMQCYAKMIPLCTENWKRAFERGRN